MSEPHRYAIRPKNPNAHIYEVRLTVAAPDPAGQVLEFPAWTPGSYMIRDYARHVIGAKAEADGREVELVKIDKSRWQAEVVDARLTLIFEIYAYDDSVRGAHLDNTHAYFIGPCVFPSVTGQEDRECIVDIQPPEEGFARDWRVATAMQRRDAAAYGFGTYTGKDYDELIDHPVEIGQLAIGEFDAGGIPHAIAIRGRTRVDMARICHDLQAVCEQHMELLAPPSDLDRYLFLLNAPAKGYGGLEHRWSSSLVCSRDNLPQRGEREVSDGYRTFLGLASHEYFHLWNVKRLKPAAFTPYKLDSEAYTQLLWVFEGITSYYDDLALVRAGLITPESYLELLGQTTTRVLRTGGRQRQSVAESSFDAWTKLYKQDANAPNSIISYYTKGALIAATLDLKLRETTDGEVTLDTVMRECWRRWGEGEQGMPEDGFEAVCAEIAGDELADFFEASVRGKSDLPLQAALASVGVEFHLRPASGPSDKGGKKDNGKRKAPLWLGANLAEAEGKSTFVSIMNGGPAEKAGIAPGDVAVALDGMQLNAGNLEQRLKTLRAGETVPLVVFRDEDLVTTDLTLAEAPADTCYLEIDEEAELNTVARRDDWLNSA